MRGRDDGDVEVLPRTSLASVALAVGVTLALVGAVVGQAVLWPGAGIAALALGGLARERRAARRLLRDANAGTGTGTGSEARR